jgi:hypothetical protein
MIDSFHCIQLAYIILERVFLLIMEFHAFGILNYVFFIVVVKYYVIVDIYKICVFLVIYLFRIQRVYHQYGFLEQNKLKNVIFWDVTPCGSHKN